MAREANGRSAGGALPWVVALAAFAAALTRTDFSGTWYGMYLLAQPQHAGLSLQDDLLFGQGDRLLAGVSLAGARALVHAGDRLSAAGPYLDAEWDDALGRGLVRNHLGDGTELHTFLARFENGGADGNARHGVFVGGSVPDVAADVAMSNESGMAFRDGSGRWRHVWCNANEAIWDDAAQQTIETWRYEYLGSRVLGHDSTRFVVSSAHRVLVSGVPLRMERTATFRAGERFLTLEVAFTNEGDRDAAFSWLYGDEPWVGNFGSSYGNLGWTEEGVFADEAMLDARRVRTAGIVDTNSGTAAFLAWPPAAPPDMLYVSNRMGLLVPGVPLASGEIFIGTEWREVLRPGERRVMRLAIGMGVRDATGRLRAPDGVFPDPR